jgi:hypothetical protein
LAVPAYQSIEYSKDVASVFYNAEKDIAQARVSLGIAVPFCQHCRRHFDIAAKLLWRMAAQKQSIEKCRFALRKSEVRGDIGGYELGRSGHRERAVYRKRSPRQVVRQAACRLPGNRVLSTVAMQYEPE